MGQFDKELKKLCRALVTVHLQLAPGHFERIRGKWRYTARTFCHTGSTRVQLIIRKKYCEVVGISNDSASDAIFKLIRKLEKNTLEVSSANGKEKTLYRFDRKNFKFLKK